MGRSDLPHRLGGRDDAWVGRYCGRHGSCWRTKGEVGHDLLAVWLGGHFIGWPLLRSPQRHLIGGVQLVSLVGLLLLRPPSQHTVVVATCQLASNAVPHIFDIGKPAPLVQDRQAP